MSPCCVGSGDEKAASRHGCCGLFTSHCRFCGWVTKCLLPSHSFQIVENQSGRWPEPLEFHDCVYFIIVSFCTVGYGDVTPQSTLGRITVIVMLSWSLIVVRPGARTPVTGGASVPTTLSGLQ